ncbi:helix-turn-helix transcriptional regulator [Sciscionella sediminilitoris]|uniref:helix-turn-helix transcriptional regulator n=1 Tax=Sciscionella sediminilitoris TaxID=1445613 RepID=UPI0004DFA85E|nr:HTH domain-containing protein [Sciscionella sp. SE31]
MSDLEPTAQLHQVLPLVERQHALIEYLRIRAPKTTTGKRLAEELGVSTRTVERDVLALRAAGLPLTVRSGPGGGYRIDARAELPPIRFSPGEASALVAALVAVGPFTSATAQSAFAKILEAMEPG